MADGRIMAGADQAGLNIIQLGDDFFEKDAPPVITRLSLPHETQVYGMGKDKTGTMWIGELDGDVFRFDPLNNRFIKLENAKLINSGYYTQDGSILINGNLFLSDGKDIDPLFDISKTPAGNILLRPKQKLWINYHRELYFYDISKWEPGKPIQWDLQLPADTRLVCPFIIDHSGMLWSGSVGYGLRKYNTAGTKFKRHLPREYSVRWIIPLTANDILIGNYAYAWRRLLNTTTPPTSPASSNRRTHFLRMNGAQSMWRRLYDWLVIIHYCLSFHKN